MEEDDLKNIWKMTQKSAAEKTDISSVYTSKSTNLIDKILDTIKLEQRMNVILFPAIVIFFGVLEEYLLAIISLVLGIGAILYYRNLILKLNRSSVEHSVVDYLNECYLSIRVFRRHYLTIGVVMFIFGFCMGSNLVSDLFEGEVENLTKVVIVSIGIGVLAFICVHIIFYFLYGKNVKKLKESVEALRNEE